MHHYWPLLFFIIILKNLAHCTRFCRVQWYFCLPFAYLLTNFPFVNPSIIMSAPTMDNSNKQCDELFHLICDTIKKQLKPAMLEIFKSHPDHTFTSVDLQTIVRNIFPTNEEGAADFVYQYDKKFVTKVNDNKRRVQKLNADIESLTNKLNVLSQRQEKDRKKIKNNYESAVAKHVEHEMKFDNVSAKLNSLPNTSESSVLQRLENLEKDVEVAKFAIFSNKNLIVNTERSINDNFMGLKDDLKAATRIIHEILDEHEQYSRRAILELHGVPYNKYNDNTNRIVTNVFAAMGVKVSRQDLDRSHRQFGYAGSAGKRKPPIILVKFVSHDLRDFIYSKRDVLRNLPGFRHLYINENLTKVRRNLFRQVRKMSDFESWTYDGKIYMRHFVYPNVRHVVTTRADLDKILQ